MWPPVSDMLACPEDRFSSEELLPVHSGRLCKNSKKGRTMTFSNFCPSNSYFLMRIYRRLKYFHIPEVHGVHVN